MIRQMADLARQAGQMILSAHDAAVHAKEGHYNFVTDTDVAVQQFLKDGLLSLLPGSRFFAEEQKNAPLTCDPTFVVDPIDGTINFMRNRRASSVSIAMLENKTPTAGVIFNPYSNEMFTAEKGKGAFCNGQAIRVSKTPFENALVMLGTAPYDAELAEKTMRCAGQFLMQAGDLRRSGSAAIDLCDVACGRADVFFELRLRPWDVAAGCLIVQEAGGKFFSLGHAAPWFDDSCGVLACNAVCERQAMNILTNEI